MPAGNVTLLEAAKYGSSDKLLASGIVETLIQESPILEMLPWETISGPAIKHMVEEDLPSVQFRDVNEGYSRSWGTDTEHFWGTAILGGEVFVDNYLLKVVGDRESVKARQYAKLGKANARTFDRFFFDGTGTAKDFRGVNSLISLGFGQSLAHAANGATLNSVAGLDTLDTAHDLLRTGSADAILLNRTVRRQITRAARTAVTGISLIDVGSDTFGRQVMSWNDVPMRIVGDDEQGLPILGFDETQGSSNICSSLYMVRFGDDKVKGLLGLGGSFEVKDFGETEAAPGHLGRLEWYPGIAVLDRFAIVRVTGILAAFS